MTDRAPDIKEILDSYDRSQEALNFTPRSDNDIRAQMIAKAVREWEGDLVAALEPLANFASLIAQKYPGWNHDAFPILRVGQYQDEVRLTMKPFRAAFVALKDTK